MNLSTISLLNSVRGSFSGSLSSKSPKTVEEKTLPVFEMAASWSKESLWSLDRRSRTCCGAFSGDGGGMLFDGWPAISIVKRLDFLSDSEGGNWVILICFVLSRGDASCSRVLDSLKNHELVETPFASPIIGRLAPTQEAERKLAEI